MKNRDLAEDYLFRSENRLAALEVLFARKSWADVVREAQEIVELCLKAVLRISKIEVPRLHDVSDVLKKEASKLAPEIRLQLKEISRISRNLRRDRELAFYGTEDLTPSVFYEEEDAKKAFEDAKWVFDLCQQISKAK